ncbi:hypothetical protein PDIG_38860 [Penicillium digitatum PHI26]|uniref:Uncharacterized protein n=2 Tax=Penicillium digitatum TaxID=36651 RepID=K9FY13_PEND2|nr:hypothetical protein PDIP_85480 [Penicillium digitatum Pd1]EKV04955.1 hypothetical protein PDIP_85480 [Penicillium digitatum Pd1]EKV13387.1 hypothetical protein PDIG_38860 [Penicillium digitatum PHI26]
MDGEIEEVYVRAVLELTGVLVELMELTELVVVSGKTGREDEIDIRELVDRTGMVHMLLGWLEDSEVAEIGKSPVELDRTEVVGVRVEVVDSDISVVVVELEFDIMLSCFFVDSLVVVRVTVTAVGFCVDDEKSGTVVVAVLESGPGPDIV